MNCAPVESSTWLYVGGEDDVSFQILVVPSREAVMAKEDSGRRTARTYAGVRLTYDKRRSCASTHITSMSGQRCSEFVRDNSTPFNTLHLHDTCIVSLLVLLMSAYQVEMFGR